MIQLAMNNLKRFFRLNSKTVNYEASVSAARSRTGVVSGVVTAPLSVPVRAVIDRNPKLEEITAFGDASEYRPGTRAVIRVISADLLPANGGVFTIPDETPARAFTVLAVNPLHEANELWAFDCLVGFE